MNKIKMNGEKILMIKWIIKTGRSVTTCIRHSSFSLSYTHTHTHLFVFLTSFGHFLSFSFVSCNANTKSCIVSWRDHIYQQQKCTHTHMHTCTNTHVNEHIYKCTLSYFLMVCLKFLHLCKSFCIKLLLSIFPYNYNIFS